MSAEALQLELVFDRSKRMRNIAAAQDCDAAPRKMSWRKRQKLVRNGELLPGRGPPRTGSQMKASEALSVGLLPTAWFHSDGMVKREFRDLAAAAIAQRRMAGGHSVRG